jgi:hypothetical protein
VSTHLVYNLDLGCTDYTHRLGIAKMPAGYALLLNPDETHFFWLCLSDGRESSIDWNKWRVRRGAVADSRIIAAQKRATEIFK